MATSNNPRKFSEKIALHNQKQAEETAAFEEVMKDLSITRAARVRTSLSGLSPSSVRFVCSDLSDVGYRAPRQAGSRQQAGRQAGRQHTAWPAMVNNNKRHSLPAGALLSLSSLQTEHAADIRHSGIIWTVRSLI